MLLTSFAGAAERQLTGTITTMEQNKKLVDSMKSVKNNDATPNVTALNAKLRELRLPVIDMTAKDFKFKTTRESGIRSKVVGVSVTDGKYSYCLPCRVGKEFVWGINKGTSQAVAADGRIMESTEFPCAGTTYVHIQKCSSEDLDVCWNNPKEVTDLFCSGKYLSNLAECQKEETAEQASCRDQYKAWKARVPADAAKGCQQATREHFDCHTPVAVSPTKSETAFSVVRCADKSPTGFCPESVYVNGSYSKCLEFEDPQQKWVDCKKEYLYNLHKKDLATCGRPAVIACKKALWSDPVTLSEFNCLYDLAVKKTQYDQGAKNIREWIPGFDDTPCKYLVKSENADVSDIPGAVPSVRPGYSPNAPKTTR
jgi:hypothetical protein